MLIINHLKQPLTEDPDGFRRLMTSCPEQVQLITVFENLYLSHIDEEINYHHHEEGLTSQRSFQQVNNHTSTIIDYGNPFQDDCPELLILHTRVCANPQVLGTVHKGRPLKK